MYTKRDGFIFLASSRELWPVPCSVSEWQTVPHDLLPGLEERLAATPHCHGKVKTTDTLGGLSPPHYHLDKKKTKKKQTHQTSAGDKIRLKTQIFLREPCTAATSHAVSTDVIL